MICNSPFNAYRNFGPKIFNFLHISKIANFLILLLLILNSCKDYGCIEADDFGEYEVENLTILSNNLNGYCDYKNGFSVNSTEHGEGLKQCLISESYTDNPTTSSGQTATVNGCIKLNDGSPSQKDCIENCKNKCLQNANAGTTLNFEPNWKSTSARDNDNDSGLLIRSASEIKIRAIGDINLGNKISYGNVLVRANNKKLNIDKFVDILKGQNIMTKFSGSWTDASDSGNPANTILGGNQGTNEATPTRIFNNARRLVAYTIEHPEGYGFNTSASDEKSGSIGVPLIPDTRAWRCIHNDPSVSSIANQTVCSREGLDIELDNYVAIGYTQANNKEASRVFNVGTDKESLTDYGGFIRWNNDGLQKSTFDPFNGITCSTSSICNPDVDEEYGQIVGDISSGDSLITLKDMGKYSYRASFKSLVSGCNNFNINVSVRNDSTSADLKNFIINVKNSLWSEQIIDIETDESLVIKYNQTKVDGNSCGKYLAVRFLRYHDVEIKKSGYAKLTMIQSSSAQNCTIKARIVNKNASKQGSYIINNLSCIEDQGSSGLIGCQAVSSECSDSSSNKYCSLSCRKPITCSQNGTYPEYKKTGCTVGSIPSGCVHSNGSDSVKCERCAIAMREAAEQSAKKRFNNFYEYHDFSTGSINNNISGESLSDPLKNYDVPSTIGVSASSVANYGDEFFVRKGQIIRFAPESWNNTWTTDSVIKDCGVGMALIIEPYPALLCRGNGNDTVRNPECQEDFDSNGNLIGCKAYSIKCDVPTDGATNAFCQESCRKPINCTTNGSSPLYQKSGCTIGAMPSACTYKDGSSSTTCNKCADLMLEAAKKSAKINISNADICYDLENYKNSSLDIPINSQGGVTSQEVDLFLQENKAYGISKINTFSGYYGNFESYLRLDETDSGNTVFQSNVAIGGGKNSRLKFALLDGRNFIESASSSENAYANNSDSIKLSLQGDLQFKNGQWLEALLCNESSSTSTVCKGSSIPVEVNTQPSIVKINSSSSSISPDSVDYGFDSYGDLIRKSGGTTGANCNPSQHGKNPVIGSNFYCHTHGFTNSNPDNIAKNLRISFKIKDPETPNCSISSGSPLNGVLVENKNYDSKSADTGYCHASDSANCKKKYLCLDKYANNSGNYDVVVSVKKKENESISNLIGSNSNLIGSDIQNIIEELDGAYEDNPTTTTYDERIGQVEKMYKAIIADPSYKLILKLAVVISIIFYGLGFLAGISDLKQSEIINRLIKIAIIYLFIGESGWYWFKLLFVNVFKEGANYLTFILANTFTDSAEIDAAISSRNFSDKSPIFISIDKNVSLILSSALMKKTAALLFSSIFGWFYLLIIYWSMFSYIYAIAYSVLLYLTSQFFISVLLILGPLFFIFLIFNQTKDMFDKWLKALIGFSLQQVFLASTLAFFNLLIYETIKLIFGYRICWEEIWTIHAVVRISLLSFWTISSVSPGITQGYDAGQYGTPHGVPSLFHILSLWLIVSLMRKFLPFMADSAASIAGGIKASDLAKDISGSVQSMIKQAKGIANHYAEKTPLPRMYRSAIAYGDKKLFNSGALADKERDQAKKQNSINQKYKEEMAKAGDEAVEKYKIDNASSLMNKSSKERKEELKKVRDDAMNKKAKEFGLNDKQIKELKESKGLNYVGDNIFEAALQAAKQAIFGGGSLLTPLKDRQINDGYSESSAQKAMENMTPEQRKDFMNKVESGDIKVEKNKKEKAADIASKVANSAKEKALSAISSAPSQIKNIANAGANLVADIAKGNIKKIASDTAKSAQSLASKGASAISSQASSLAQSLASKVSNKAKDLNQLRKDFNEAEKQLEKSGAINKQISGTGGLLRDKQELNAIRAKMLENREQRAIENNTPNIETLGKLKQAEEMLNARDKIQQEKQISESGIDRKLSKRDLDKASNIQGKLENKNVDQAQLAKNVKEKFNKRLDREISKHSKRKEKLESLMGKLNPQESDQSQKKYHAYSDEIKNTNKKLENLQSLKNKFNKSESNSPQQPNEDNEDDDQKQ